MNIKPVHIYNILVKCDISVTVPVLGLLFLWLGYAFIRNVGGYVFNVKVEWWESNNGICWYGWIVVTVGSRFGASFFNY